ncbi:MAG: CoB--CoM heterodisulfide reductase iron-sulfur subunit A family protein, partial [Desulfobacterales bacterium]|nr:CoB--CoM heterodisulfide reductase iron-sulfur subunit A family protein [Desulfobacterales bacterium]
QAVPLKYAIDPKNCIYVTRKRCKACEKLCPAKAILIDEEETEVTLNVGSVLLAAGCEAYDPNKFDAYGYGKSKDIVTSLEFERILSASGPFGGHLIRPSNKKEPEKIAWLQCIGSRDVHVGARGYCSGVCCTYAIKEAILAKEHAAGDLDAAIFYIDIRTHGKDFETYYNHARDDLGVRFVKSRITEIGPLNGDGKHILRYVDETGALREEAFDMVVLSVGLGVGGEAAALAERLDVNLDEHGFVQTRDFSPVETSRPGVFVCGAFQAPKDIPSSVIDASAAAGLVGSELADARWSRTKTEDIPEERDLRGEPLRIGVFVCCCGTNIAGVVDVPGVVEFAKTLPGVAYAEQNLFSCAQDTQDKMTAIIKENRLNRVVVAACTPRTHEPLFQDTLTSAGLNKYLFEMANIRNHCSWVHREEKETATEKARDMVRMAVAKAAKHEPLTEPSIPVKPAGLVIGGGVAGMVASKNLAQQGYRVHLVEKSNVLGGRARLMRETWKGEAIQPYLSDLIASVNAEENIEVHLNAEIERVDGFVGKFTTTVKNGEGSKALEHGAAIIASGAGEYKPGEYAYGKDPRVLTGMEFQQKELTDPLFQNAGAVVFIQCVGSRIPERPYCSRVCCTRSIKSAMELKQTHPGLNVYVLYRDMRPYSLREALYREARALGVKFIRYDSGPGIDVDPAPEKLRVRFTDLVLRRPMEIGAGALVLAAAITPEKRNPLANLFKAPQNDDGFFMEAHVKLRPNDFATDGVFVCGLAHAPKSIDESIAQALAASARAATLLSTDTISVNGAVARVDAASCSGCGVCASICPFSAPKLSEKTGLGEIESALCKGCGLCAASCRSGAIHLLGFESSQIFSMISASLMDELSAEGFST